MAFPAGYHPELLGEFEARAKAQNRLFGFALLSILGVLMVLYADFRSWRLTLMAFATLPFALAAGVWTASAESFEACARRLRSAPPVGQREAQQADEVLEVDPRQPLPTGSQRSAEAQARRGQHLRQGPAVGGEHDPDAHAGDANAQRGRRLGRGLPALAELGEVAVAAARRLVEHLVAAIAEVADGAGLDPHAGATREGLQRGGDALVEPDPRVLDRAASGVVPPLQHRLAGEVDDRVDPTERGLQRRIAAARVDELDLGAQGGPRRVGAADPRDHAVTVGEQAATQGATDEAGRAEDEDVHASRLPQPRCARRPTTAARPGRRRRPTRCYGRGARAPCGSPGGRAASG